MKRTPVKNTTSNMATNNNLIPLTGLYSIYTVPKGAKNVELIEGKFISWMTGEKTGEGRMLPKPHTYTAIGFPADVSEEMAADMVENECQECKGEDMKPCCDTGKCQPYPTKEGYSMCICCGAEMFKQDDSWYHHSS